MGNSKDHIKSDSHMRNQVGELHTDDLFCTVCGEIGKKQGYQNGFMWYRCTNPDCQEYEKSHVEIYHIKGEIGFVGELEKNKLKFEIITDLVGAEYGNKALIKLLKKMDDVLKNPKPENKNKKCPIHNVKLCWDGSEWVCPVGV